MCFYDANEMACKCWKWGHFRQHCAKEYRTGETCGMKLVMNRYSLPMKCKICTKIDIGERVIRKEEERVRRWKKVWPEQITSREKAQQGIDQLKMEISDLLSERYGGIDSMDQSTPDAAASSMHSEDFVSQITNENFGPSETTDSTTGLAIPGERCNIPQTFDSSSATNPLPGEPNLPGGSKKEFLDDLSACQSAGMAIYGGLPQDTFDTSLRWENKPNRLQSRTSAPSSPEINSSSKLGGAASNSVANFATRCRPSPENQRKVLRVLIKNKEHLACPDSGSAKNIMSECLANNSGLKIRRSPKDIKQFELGSGKYISSVGRVRVYVELLGNALGRKKCCFYVFSICPVPLILGMPFLEEAEIMTKNRHMLESCPAELSNISSLLWIGSPRSSNSPRNRFQCLLDEHKLEAIADTGSDLNLMSLKCAKREGFQIDRRREARRRIRVGDGTEAETIGQVYVYNLSLDWRKAPTTPNIPAQINSTVNAPQDISPEINESNFGAIFQVLPGLPCDVIFGRDLLDKADAFNLCPNLYPTRPAKKDNPFELNVLISLGPVPVILSIPWRRWQRHAVNPGPKEKHDNARHAEMFRRTKKEEEIALLPVELRGLARSREKRKIGDWDAFHRTCIYCNPV
ncbi:hypothetical protein V8E51_017438 [Hyaloscypha variabilis]